MLAASRHRGAGDLLALPGKLRPTDLLDVWLRLIPAAPGPLMQNDRLDLFVGAAEVHCRVTLRGVAALLLWAFAGGLVMVLGPQIRRHPVAQPEMFAEPGVGT